MKVVEQLPGEPERKTVGNVSFVMRLFVKLGLLALLFVATLPLWPVYWILAALLGRPPNVPAGSQILRYLGLAWTADPPAPGLGVRSRVWITLLVMQQGLLIPVKGLAWLLDEILYGRALDSTPMVAPLIEISAGRSGSTQIARYLEADPGLVAPSLLQCLFPYLWLWRLVPHTLGRFVTKESVQRKIESILPPELLERHESDVFKSDTFDSALYTAHLNHLSLALGPEVAVDDFGFASIATHNRRLWEEVFPALFDRIARKTLLSAAAGAECPGGRRYFVKGHFLCAAPVLARRYPDASFLTVIRDPASRLQSAINYLRVNPSDPVLGPVPWAWLGETLLRTEVEYNEVEQDWFTRADGPRRCVIRFSDFVRDLEGTMRQVHRDCLDSDAVPDHVPKNHPPRERRHYTVNRSLAEIGIDEAELNSRLSRFLEWCGGGGR
jgi:hypothetical protein